MADNAQYRLPAEWEPHQCSWMAWPRSQTWGEGWQEAEIAYARVANHISEHETVTMVCDADTKARAQKRLNSQIECQVFAYDDAWLRDTGPVFIHKNDNTVLGVGWNFNGWGDKFKPWQQDQSLAGQITQRIGSAYLTANIVAEGGAIHGDGQGTLLTTKQCLLNSNRNPSIDQAKIEHELMRLTGMQQVLWLAEGLQDDHTDGHIDELACFARPGTILLCGCVDQQDFNYSVIQEASRFLQTATDLQGRSFEVVTVSQPEQRRCRGGHRLTLSYINFYLCNGALIMPAFDQPRHDANARSILSEQFPDRVIHQLPALPIAVGGGGIHCITQQQPKAA